MKHLKDFNCIKLCLVGLIGLAGCSGPVERTPLYTVDWSNTTGQQELSVQELPNGVVVLETVER